MLINSTGTWLLVISFSMSPISLFSFNGLSVRTAGAQEVYPSPLCYQVAEASSANSAPDYSSLEDLLESQNWQAADEETYSLILQAADREDRGWLGADDMTAFPCSVLQRIDELWLQYSDGHFGYSVQTAIEKDCFNEYADFYPAAMQCLADAVSWNDWQDTEFNFSQSAPAGHLPATNMRLAKALSEACGDYSAVEDPENALAQEDFQQCSRGMMMFAYASPLALMYASDCDYFDQERAESELAQEEATDLYNQGNELRDQGEIEAAEATFRQAVELQPDFAEAYKNLGVVVGMQGRLDEAHEIFLHTLELDPSHSAAYSNLGKIFFLQDNFEAAVEAYQQAIKLDPTDAISYNGLGLFLREQDQIEEAVEAFQRAIEIQPNYEQAQNHLRETQLLLNQ